jgi:hypothetical protein
VVVVVVVSNEVVASQAATYHLLASGTCNPSPVQYYIYASFSHPSHFTLKMVAAWTSEKLMPYHNTLHRITTQKAPV